MAQPAPARLCVLISGSGSNLQAILDACRDGQLPAEVVCVLSNRADAYGLARARAAGVETAWIDHRAFPDRAAFDAALAERIDAAQPDWIVLAGFMRILTEGFVTRFLGRLINIHPSLLPKYPGLDTHARALAAGDAEHGATVHFVTPTVDAGPPIIQGVLGLTAADTPDSVKARVHALEHRIYPEALRLLIDGAVRFDAGQALWRDGRRTPVQVRETDTLPVASPTPLAQAAGNTPVDK
ncbi:phosphoribosylglycinamide formyltransferase [Halothiobacillus sp. DCM-1]|uniref:phosphoribosylglycinamide formyltransferase n=1 Tax=Halothiobacillus sp. DCM-1 TaxID=3112558 RepID=UPI0032471A6E